MFVVLLSHLLALGVDQRTIVIREPVPQHDRFTYEFTCNGRVSRITYAGTRGGPDRVENFVVEDRPMPAEELALINRLVGDLDIEEISAFRCDGETEQVETQILVVFSQSSATRANRRHIMAVETRGNTIQRIRGLGPPRIRASSPPRSAQPNR